MRDSRETTGDARESYSASEATLPEAIGLCPVHPERQVELVAVLSRLWGRWKWRNNWPEQTSSQSSLLALRTNPALLTNDAVLAAYHPSLQGALEAFLRFHATEGREALVEAVLAEFPSTWRTRDIARPVADAVVTSLVGRRASDD